MNVHSTSTAVASERLDAHGGVLFAPPVGRDRYEAMGGLEEVLHFPLADLHMIPGEGAPAFCRVRRAQNHDHM